MRLMDLQLEVADLMALYAHHQRHLSAMSMYISGPSETFCLELFQEMFDLPNLRNLNADKANYPGIDLGDDVARRAFQITADPKLPKVLTTLKKSLKAGVTSKYPRIQVYVTTQKQRSYSQDSIDKKIGDALKFDGSKDVLDSTDVVRAFKQLGIDKAEKVAAIIRKHVSLATEVSAPEVKDALERDIENRLQEAVDRSPFPELKDQDELANLAEELLARGASLSPLLRRRVLIRAARSAALRKRADDAERFVTEAKKLPGSDSVEPALSLLIEARGDFEGALRLLRDRRDPESISTMIGVLARAKGDEHALDWMDSQNVRVDELTTHGVLVLSIIYLGQNRIEDLRARLDQLTAAQIEASPYIAYLRGAIRLVSVLPKSAHSIGLGTILLDVGFAHPILEAAALSARLDGAIDDLQGSSARMRELRLPRALTNAHWYLAWASLMHPSRRIDALRQLETDMQVPALAVQRVQLAFRYLKNFDSTSLETYLKRRQTTGGLEDDDLIADLILRIHQGNHREVTALLTKNEVRYQKLLAPQIVVGFRIRAMVYAGDAGAARAALDANRQQLNSATIATIEAEIASAEGADPVTEYVRLYEKLKTEASLSTLVDVLIRESNHQLLGPYAEKLYAISLDPRDMVIAAKAYAAAARHEDFIRVVEAFPFTTERSLEVKQRYAWRLLRLGRLAQSKQIADSMKTGPKTRDVPLEINLAVETGQWEMLTEPLGVYLASQEEKDALALIQAAHLAFVSGHGPYGALVSAAVAKPDAGPEVLLGAYTIAIEGGLEDKDPPPFEWFSRALAMSGPDGPVKHMEMKDLLDQQIEWNRHSRRINDLVIGGDAPLIIAAPSLHTTLVDLVLGNFIRNVDQKDTRRRTVVPLFAGRRPPMPVGEAKCIALDISAVLVLGFLGLLPKVIASFEAIVIPAGLMRELLQGQKRIKEFQRSQVDRAKEIQNLLRGGLKVLRVPPSTPDEIAELVGADLAALLQAARAEGGIVVRPAPVLRLKSQGRETADMGSFADSLTDMHTLLQAMRDIGLVDSKTASVAQQYFKLQDRGWPSNAIPTKERALYLDDVAISYLQTTHLLGNVVKGFDTVYILSSTEEEAASWLEVERQGEAALNFIGSIRGAIGDAFAAGKLTFGPYRTDGESDEAPEIADLTDMSTMNLIENSLGADVVVLDDRALNKDYIITDNAQKHVRIATTLDVIEDLAAREILSAEDRLALRHQLRTVGASLVPIDADEILLAAQSSGSVESPEFREISNSIRLARVRQVPRFPAEIPWFVSIANAVRVAVKDVWKHEPDESRASALADLLYSEAPRGADWVALWRGEEPPNWSNAMNRVMAASLALAIELDDKDVRAAYFKWLEERVLAPMRVLDPDAYRATVEQVKNYIASGTRTDG
jgi:hypothetical protein